MQGAWRLVAAVVLVGAASGVPAAWAQDVAVEFVSGRATLRAEAVPLRDVIREWARVGGARVTNIDAVGRDLVTLEFVDRAETDILDALLRGLPGYVLVARPGARPDESTYGHLLILAAPAGGPPRLADGPPRPLTGVPLNGATPARPTNRNLSVFPDDDALIDELSDPDTVQDQQPGPTARPSFPSGGTGLPGGGSARPGEISPAPEEDTEP